MAFSKKIRGARGNETQKPVDCKSFFFAFGPIQIITTKTILIVMIMQLKMKRAQQSLKMNVKVSCAKLS